MIYENFRQLTDHVQGFTSRKKVVVVAAEDEHTLDAVFQAQKEHIVDPVLVGDAAKISEYLASQGISVPDSVLIPASNPIEAAVKAVELVNHGGADVMMKGKIQTADLLKEVVNKERGLRKSQLMSHVTFLEVPGYHKLLAMTDGGMVMYPTLAEKKSLIENAIALMKNMGYDMPNVGILAAVEVLNPKMPETVDADELKKMNQRGEITGCVIEGPISYDLAMSKESAHLKGYSSPVTGEVDLLIVPNIATGNIMAKALIYSAGAKMAGVIVGAKVPIVLTSRGASTEEKFLSLVLSTSAA